MDFVNYPNRNYAAAAPRLVESPVRAVGVQSLRRSGYIADPGVGVVNTGVVAANVVNTGATRIIGNNTGGGRVVAVNNLGTINTTTAGYTGQVVNTGVQYVNAGQQYVGTTGVQYVNSGAQVVNTGAQYVTQPSTTYVTGGKFSREASRCLYQSIGG